MSDIHIPVLKEEVIEALGVVSNGKYIDATVGGAGHTIEIVKRGGIVLGLDQDGSAIVAARGNINRLVGERQKNVTLVQANFRNIEQIAKEQGFTNIHGVLFDLGVSSMQLDSPKRGFSYRFTDAPLDGRMDPSGGDTAAQLVNRKTREELYDVISTYGEEQLAHAITDALCRARKVKPVQTVGDVVHIVEEIVPNENARHGVLSRVFQGLRIAVNDELGSLKKGLEGASAVLGPGGRLVVISFHSLEDRIVKLYMRSDAWQVVTRHPIRPKDQEIEVNIRSRSAKMRVAIKKTI